ncbi:MAG: hypothetical protein JOZ30_13785 [Hyphomicrobiales bacterium]|nr:hypothetical protein [Hyphomicrobiales bacterium]
MNIPLFHGEILEAGDFVEQPPAGLVARARRGVKAGHDCQSGAVSEPEVLVAQGAPGSSLPFG